MFSLRAEVMQVVLLVMGIAASAFFSWLFTHLYYKKALKQQSGIAAEQMKQLMELVNLGRQAADTSRQVTRQKRIEECIVEYQRAGTPARLIDTYDDLKDEEKADLLDTIMLRVKGRKAKVNKYRQTP